MAEDIQQDKSPMIFSSDCKRMHLQALFQNQNQVDKQVHKMHQEDGHKSHGRSPELEVWDIF